MKIVGIIGIFVMTFGGFFLAGGKMKVITGVIIPAMPGEMMIIFGCALAAFIIANTPHTVKSTISYLGKITNPQAHSKEDYLELLSMLYVVFKTARTKGWLALESHIEAPDSSELFQNFPKFSGNHHALIMLCDYLRIISLGNDKPHEIESLFDQELETIAEEKGHPGHAVQTMADGIPALGIVAAVLGVIKTMASISEPPEVLGKLIGGAIVGTFLGVWFAYGYFGPIASAMAAKGETKVMY
ncbi:MAG TPA: flagellar motor stator protein MotA, partial [Rhodospirillaceae bacterium]|nr:flagellar motor stator protein MotA [Rhodospirillaceae bacterium]